MTDGGWIFSGKQAIALLPLMLIAVGVTLVLALRRDRQRRSEDARDED